MDQIRIINLGRVSLTVKITGPQGTGTVQLQARASAYLPPDHDVEHNYAVSTPDLRVVRPEPAPAAKPVTTASEE